MSDETPPRYDPRVAFSARTEWERAPTPLARRFAELQREMGSPGMAGLESGAAGAAAGRADAASGSEATNRARLIDLTESNPTRAGFTYPEDVVREAIARPRSLLYEPEPLGLVRAREAVAGRIGAEPGRIVLTSSTSEAYAWLFKLLCEPGAGDEVLIPSPSYPLFDYIAQVEGVKVVRYPLMYEGGRWRLEIDDLARAAGAQVRAIIIVQPNNPTGSALDDDDLSALDRFCAGRGLSIISDEVFADYPFADGGTIASLTRSPSASSSLTFTLGGLSKAAGLPQMKLSWIVAGGPAAAREEALARLEIIGDTFLSVGTPVQHAAGTLLDAGMDVRRQILHRVRANRELAANICRRPGSILELLGADGGWYAVLRLPRVRSEEEWALELLEEDGVYVHPGYLFDFDGDGYLVVSLLPMEAAFAEGIERIAARVATIVGGG